MGSKHILIVDDEEDLREILQFNLENEGYDVGVAASAEEALDILSDCNFSLILLDVMMEGMSGYKMAETLRKDGNQTPIIFLTAKDSENDMLTGFSVGGDDYISKPFSVKEVAARVKALIKRSTLVATAPVEQQEVSQNIVAGALEIDIKTKSVSLAGNNITLTRKEFELLCILAATPNRVFSREEFLSKIWSDDVYVLERTVDVHITRLRKKLGQYSKYIVNRSGYGYCLEID